MYYLKVISIILTTFFCGYFIACSKNDDSTNPIKDPPGDISWELQGLDSCMVLSLAVSPGGSLLAGTDYGLYKSTDDGLNWIHSEQYLFNSNVTCFYVSKAGYILAGTSSKGIFISSDDGDTWQNLGLLNISIASIAVDTLDRIFAGTRGSGIYISSACS